MFSSKLCKTAADVALLHKFNNTSTLTMLRVEEWWSRDQTCEPYNILGGWGVNIIRLVMGVETLQFSADIIQLRYNRYTKHRLSSKVATCTHS